MTIKPQEPTALSSDEGTVLITAEPEITEREVHYDREAIIRRLDACYLDVVEEMSDFQEQWQSDPALALLNAMNQGIEDGQTEWFNDQKALFTADFWIEMGGNVKNFGGNVYDRFRDYAPIHYKAVCYAYSVVSESKKDETLQNWSWWNVSFEKITQKVQDDINNKYNTTISEVNATKESLEKNWKRLNAIYKHREKIVGLIDLIALGEPKPIQEFVDTIVNDIDPEWADAIRKNPDFYIFLEILSDQESILNYLSYISLFYDAIPPNFFLYIGGKTGGYLALEVLLTVLLSLMTEGAYAVGRIALLTARLSTTGARTAKVLQKIEKAEAAAESFIRCINDLSEALNQLQDLGTKLVKARARGVQIRGNTRQTLSARRDFIRRDKRCQCCGRTDHSSPRSKGHGILVYR